jgi:hypothetical protein
MLVFPVGMLCCIVGMIEHAPAIPIFACLLFGIGLFVLSLDRQDRPDRPFLQILFAWGFLLRVAYSVFFYYWLIQIQGEPYLGGGDDRWYEDAGRATYDLWQRGVFETNIYQPAYPIFIAFLRSCCDLLGGYHDFVTRLANACIGGLIAPCIFILVRNVYDRPIAKIASLIVVFYPEFLLYSSVQLRDIIIAFLFVFAMSQLSRFVVDGKFTGIAFSIAAVPPMLFLRNAYGYLLFGLLAMCLGGCLLFSSGRGIRHHWTKIAIMFAGVLVLAGLAITIGNKNPSDIDTGSGILQPMEEGYAIDRITSFREHNTAGASRNSVGAHLLDGAAFGLSCVVLPLVAFIMPYPPWKGLLYLSGNPLGFIYFINALAWTILMPMGLLGLLACWKRSFPKNLLTLLPLVLLLVVSSVSGFEPRYKLSAIPFAHVYVAMGFFMIFRQNTRTYGFRYWIIQAGMASIYFTAKMLIGRL